VHTHDSTITPSAHLPTVEALLAKLDEMKGNVGAKQRLEFLLQKGPEVVPGFDFNDAFDLSRQAHTERVRKLEELRAAMDVMKVRWHDSVLEDDVKSAGDRLIGHLHEFVKQARDKESRFEIETLESLWEDAPDVFPVFGLPTPSYYPKKQSQTSRDIKRADEREAREFAELEKAHDQLVEEIARENAERTELASEDEVRKKVAASFGLPTEEQLERAMGGGPADGITTEMIGQTKEALEKKDIRVPVSVGTHKEYDVVVDSRRGTVDDGQQVVGHVGMTPGERRRQLEKKAEPLGHLGLKQHDTRNPEEKLEDELDMLDIRSWTLAINEVLASNWSFSRQLRGRVGDKGRMGVTLIWTKDGSELRLDVERLASDEVLVRMTPPRSRKSWSLEEEESMYRVYAKEMKESALTELHKDPSEFVKLILV
jgi:hypothetical protein